MKKIISIILICSIVNIFLFGCDTKTLQQNVDNSTVETTTTTQMSDEEKYNTAVTYIENKNYNEAIVLLKEIPNYNDAKLLLGKVHYVYGSELFNKKEFTSAYTQFLNADGFGDIFERKSMINYYGGIYLTNNNKHVNALSYFKRALNSKYKDGATKHIEEISKQILYGVWIGDFTNNNGVKLEAHINYTNNGKFSVSYIDRASGYKVVTEFGGNLVVGAEDSVFVSGINFYKIKFDISSTSRMRITYVDNSMLSEMLVNSYEKTAEWTPSYKIENITYPTMTIPDLFSDSNNSSNVVDSSSQVESETSSNTTSLTTSQTNNLNDTSSTSQSGKPNTTSSMVSQSTKPNNSSPSDVQSSKPNNTSSEQHIHNFMIDASCEEPAKCSCGATNGTALGHTWLEGSCETPKVCSVCGKTEGSFPGHDWEDATCEAPKTCKRCGEVSDLPTGHEWEPATCENPDTCKNCGKTQGSALNHDWEEATCEDPKTCNNCNKTLGSKLGHKYETKHPFYCSICENENPESLSILKKINVVSVDSKVVIKNYSVSEFRLAGMSTPFGKFGYTFTLDFEIECISDFGTYQMNIIAYNSEGSVLSESYVMYNHYMGTLTAGEKESLSETFLIYSDTPATKIEIG